MAGFGDPPKEHQFSSTNQPKERKPRGESMTTILRDLLETEVETDVDGQKVKMTYKESILRKLLQKANKGEIKAITEMFDRVEGKAKQELTMNVEQTKKDVNQLFPFKDGEGNQS